MEAGTETIDIRTNAAPQPASAAEIMPSAGHMDVVSRARQWARARAGRQAHATGDAAGDYASLRAGTDEIARIARSLDLLTGEYGDLRIEPHRRSYLAAFREGLFLIARGQRTSLEVTSFMRTAKAMSIDLWPPVEVERSLLSLVYEEATSRHGARRAGPGADLTRQQFLADILEKAAERSASDIQIRVMEDLTEIRIRVFGRMIELMQPVDAQTGMAVINATFSVAEDTTAHANDKTFQQGVLTVGSGRLPPSLDLVRLQYNPTGAGRGSLSMRLKYKSGFGEHEIDTLGYAPEHVEAIRTMRRRTNGMYLIAGKVSSGKTTTLQRIMNAMYLEKRREISIYTIEEPVELEIEGAVQVAVTVTDRAGRSKAFLEAMNAALRSDPNVILVGELRDRETADLAVRASLSGHALWSSIHAGNALAILDRLADLGVDRWKLTDPTIVRGLVAQRLVGVMCPHCRIDLASAHRQGRIDTDLARRTVSLLNIPSAGLYLRGDGCDHCRSGLVGRTVVAETILTDATMLDLYAAGDRAGMRRYWLSPPAKAGGAGDGAPDGAPGGMGGKPMIYHALLKVAAGQLDINEMEEEVDLLSVFVRDYSMLIGPLKDEIAAMRQARRRSAETAPRDEAQGTPNGKTSEKASA